MHHLKGYFSLFRFDDPIEIIHEMYHLINTLRKILYHEFSRTVNIYRKSISPSNNELVVSKDFSESHEYSLRFLSLSGKR
jgi:hypothetical protein